MEEWRAEDDRNDNHVCISSLEERQLYAPANVSYVENVSSILFLSEKICFVNSLNSAWGQNLLTENIYNELIVVYYYCKLIL